MTSIIICFYERLTHLKNCLESLRFSRNNFDEVVISDDGSSEKTIKALHTLITNYDFPVRHVWQEKKGFRVASARNNGIRNAKGDYLIFFDCDFLILPGTVGEHLKRAQKKRFVAGNCKYLTEQETATIFHDGITIDTLEELYQKLPDENLLREQKKFSRRTWLMRLHLLSPRKQSLGGHFSIHREDLEYINGYDENFVGWGGEDEDLGIRLVKAGIYCSPAIPFAKVLHMWHPKELGDKSWHSGSNMEYLTHKGKSYVCINGLRKIEKI